jgi:hypothetical protein
MPECDCGTEITDKNAAGHYRDKCRECIRAVARDGNKHAHVCDGCGVCRSWRREREKQAQARMTIRDWRRTAARKGRISEQTTL